MSESKILKTISQQTFDDVVRENIEDFEMEPHEALEDAIQQFKSQGVNINIIIKEVPQKEGQHKVISLVRSLSDAINDATWCSDSTREILCELERELQDLSKRYQACKTTDVTSVALRLCILSETDGVHKIESLKAFSSLVNGQPDEATPERLEIFVKMLKACDNQTEAEVLACIIKHASTMQENNRQALVKMDVINILLYTLERFIGNCDVVRECCSALRALTLDDDVRVPFGKAHDHAKAIVMEHKGLDRLVAALKEHHADVNVVRELSSTLSRVMVRNEFCQQFVDLEGFLVLKSTVGHHMSNMAVVKQCVNLIQAISGNDDVKIYLVKNGGVELLLSVLDRYISNPQICESCFAALTTVSLRNPAHCKYITDQKIAPRVVQAMKIHANHPGVQKQSCRLIRNLVARTREYSSLFLELGAEELIRDARKEHCKVSADKIRQFFNPVFASYDLNI